MHRHTEDTATSTGSRTSSARPWAIRSMIAVAVAVGLTLAGSGSASAEGPTVRTGHAGAAHVAAFGGGYERTPANNYDPRPASIRCTNDSLGHQALVAGGYAWAYNAHRGAHNDWQNVRYAVVAKDSQSGQVSLGPLSRAVKAWDNAPARFGANSIGLARGHTYSIFVAFFYYNSKGKLAGSRIVTPQTGVWRNSISTYPYGEYTYVQKRSVIAC